MQFNTIILLFSYSTIYLTQFNISGSGDVLYAPDMGIANVWTIVIQITPLLPDNENFEVFDLEIEACCEGKPGHKLFLP